MTKNYISNLALKLTAVSRTEEEKIKKIYRFVKEEIKYKITVASSLKEILERGYGSCVDQSWLFLELLKSIGIKSRYHVILVDFDLLCKKFFLTRLIPSFLRPNFYFHVFNEIYSAGKWQKLDSSFDSDMEKFLQGKGFVSKEKECCVPSEYILQDLGTFNNFYDIFNEPFFSQLVSQYFSFKKITQFIINLFNWFLYIKRKNKTKGLRKKESIKNILININKLKEK